MSVLNSTTEQRRLQVCTLHAHSYSGCKCARQLQPLEVSEQLRPLEVSKCFPQIEIQYPPFVFTHRHTWSSTNLPVGPESFQPTACIRAALIRPSSRTRAALTCASLINQFRCLFPILRILSLGALDFRTAACDGCVLAHAACCPGLESSHPPCLMGLVLPYICRNAADDGVIARSICCGMLGWPHTPMATAFADASAFILACASSLLMPW